MPNELMYLHHTQCPMCAATTSPAQAIGKRLDRPQGLKPEKLAGNAIHIYRCPRCRLIYPNPAPVPANNDHYSAPLSDEQWAEREALHNTHFVYELSVLRGLLTTPLPAARALDIGCGVGSSLRTLQAAFGEVYGIEPFHTLYAQALTNTGLDASKLRRCDLSEAEFPDAHFDFIFFEALQHLPDPGAGMQRALRWLKPGGILYAEVPSSSYLFRTLLNGLYRLRGTDFVANTNPLHGNRTYTEFSKKSFEQNGTLLGYELVFYQNFPCQPPGPKVLRGLFTRLMQLTRTGMQHSVWMRKTQNR